MFRKRGLPTGIGECHVFVGERAAVVDDVPEQTLSVLHPSNGGADSAWIAAWPAPAFNLREELPDDPVVFIGLLDVDRVARVGHYRERGRRDVLLHKDARQKAWPVFIAGGDERGD